MGRFRRFGHHNQGQPATLRAIGVLLTVIVCAAGVAWSTTSAHPTSQSTLAAKQSFSVGLPVIVHLEAGQLFHTPAQPGNNPTETPSSVPTLTLTSTPSDTPIATSIATAISTSTTTPSAAPTNTPECDLNVKQNLKMRLLTPNTAEVMNSSTQCTYPIGLASYRMFDDNLSHQELFSAQTALIGPGQTLTLTVEIPTCAYQLDLFYGSLIQHFDPQHGQIYGTRILLTRVVRESGFCPPGTTTPTSISTPSATPAVTPTATSPGAPTSTLTSTPTATSPGAPTSTLTSTPTALPTNTPTAVATSTPTATPSGNTPTPTEGGT